MSSQFEIHTFGCKVNTYDSGLLDQRLKKEAKWDSKTPVHIINSCAVTQEATRETVRLARRIKSKNPFALVVATGCAAQVDSDFLLKASGIDLVVANSHKGQLAQIIDQYFKNPNKFPKLHRSNIFKKDDLEEGGGLEPKHKRAFLKIQDGCNSFCSFCIIPYARGLSRSIPIRDLVKRVQDLIEQDFLEVVLTGVHIGDYADGQKGLSHLVEAILKLTDVKRLRLGSLEPIEVTDHLLELYSDSRMCRHFHMSIQSANSQVLEKMKRKYGSQEVRESLLKIEKRVPGAFVGMDVIAGFPSETDEQFIDTYQTLSELPWTRLHVFPYSERNGTKAATFQQLPISMRKKRASLLRELSLKRFAEKAALQLGQIKQTLILGSPGKLQGVTRDYWPVRFDNDTQHKLIQFINQEVPIQIKSYHPNLVQKLEGHLLGVSL